MILRSGQFGLIKAKLDAFPITALLGPRQVGKTTLAKQIMAQWSGPTRFFDLEDPQDQARLSDADFVLRELHGLIILDEIQLRPDLFPLLRVLADRVEAPARFLILGSSAPELIRNAAESLAGRVVFHELNGLALEEISSSEVGIQKANDLWVRGGFPRAYLATDLSACQEWRSAFIRTYLERDLPQLGFNLPAITLRRFWTMLAHYHGQTWNGSVLARSLGVSDKTVSRYLDILEGTFMIYRLMPWHANLGKREVKAPKIYLSDTGILHQLLGIGDYNDLLGNPKCGASWEGFIIREIIRRTKARREEIFFWKVHSGAEIDLLLIRNGQRIGFEVKLTQSPKVTGSMRSSFEALKLEKLFVVCHGQGEPWPLSENIMAVPVACLETSDWKIVND